MGVYASSMNSTPSIALSNASVVLMAVPPMTCATRSARDTSTRWPGRRTAGPAGQESRTRCEGHGRNGRQQQSRAGAAIRSVSTVQFDGRDSSSGSACSVPRRRAHVQRPVPPETLTVSRAHLRRPILPGDLQSLPMKREYPMTDSATAGICRVTVRAPAVARFCRADHRSAGPRCSGTGAGCGWRRGRHCAVPGHGRGREAPAGHHGHGQGPGLRQRKRAGTPFPDARDAPFRPGSVPGGGPEGTGRCDRTALPPVGQA